ncbi:hypothetical protein BZJ17_13075 [Salinivibrio sp. IB574]|uniref:glycosyltransferase n=1 Tax=Salinivibrio sp. IB574 TaxID=1909444 RepID=UPI00098915F8|nr:glycosyltransferase [Salinivibrio sp. IB574]OOF20383.1 hypothetical protein BZJ17_13075 [Salinivibrio sp. IB574]
MIHSFSEKNVGPLKNFSRGIKLTSSPYIMLCDQDDVWLPEKIVKSYQKISSFCSSKPALVYCDLMIVNESLDLFSSSYFCYKKIPKTWDKHFIQLLQQNTVSGCAAIFNRALLEKATPIPDDAYMHDWWLALVAKAFGNLKLIDEPLIKYRQHANNSIGVKKRTLKRIDKQYQCFKSSMMKVEKQAKVFSKSFDVSPQTALGKDLVLISSMSALTPLQKVRLWCQRRLDRSHITGRIILLVYLLFSCK